LNEEHKNESEIEREGDNMMQVKIEPHLFRDLNEFINKDKAFFDNVSIEV